MCKIFILGSYVAEKFTKQKFSEVFWDTIYVYIEFQYLWNLYDFP